MYSSAKCGRLISSSMGFRDALFHGIIAGDGSFLLSSL